jgi:hypothetical protein
MSKDEVHMRLTLFIWVLASVFISGCAGHSIDCTMGAGRNGCVPGTKEYDEMEQKQLDAKTAAEIDDARCQAYGARGTPRYVDCRRRAMEDQPMLKPSH